MNVILASKSPRRRELLAKIGITDFAVEESGIDEDSEIRGLTEPEDIVMRLAEAKAGFVADKHEKNCIVIGSDTVVACDGRILGKPSDIKSAHEMLRMLSGREHQVYSGVAVIKNGKAYVDYECTDVCFREMNDEEIDSYIAKEPPLDKAGAYGIQGLACLFISGIRGDYYNVMGLPLYKLGKILHEAGVELL